MPPRPRKPNPVAQQLVPLLLLGIGLVSTNASVGFLNLEAATLGFAVRPLRQVLAQSVRGSGGAGFHPLFDVILHFWLIATAGTFDYLRVPSLLFLLAGLFLLGRASRRFLPSGGGIAVIWLGVLWPFGFHYGRLAAWYPFSFFLVSALTLSYLEYLEDRSKERAAVWIVFAVALIWTTYWGWAIVACLAADQLVRALTKQPTAHLKTVGIAAVILIVAFVPFFPALRAASVGAMSQHHGVRAVLVNAGLKLFSFFVSTSIAPWYWRFAVPVGIAIAACIVLGAWRLPPHAGRFLIYAAVLLALMALSETLQLGDLFLLAPWVLLPLGVAIEANKPLWATFALAAALLIIGLAGWYGIYAKRYYSDPRFLEPWQQIAVDATGQIANGATVISDESAFLLYLTYDLHAPRENGPWHFEGVLPDQVTHPGVFSPQEWVATPHTPTGRVLLVRRGAEPGETVPSDAAARQLDAACGSISSRLRARDDGYAWKQKYLPQLHAPLWRIEVREYDCAASAPR